MATGSKQYLRKRGEVWWLKLPIEKRYQPYFPTTDRQGNPTGRFQTHIEESLHTRDHTEADRKKHARIGVWFAECKRREKLASTTRQADPDLARAYELRELLDGQAPTDIDTSNIADLASELEAKLGGDPGSHTPSPALEKAQLFYSIAIGRKTLREAFDDQCRDLGRRKSTDEKYRQALEVLHTFLGAKDLFPEDVLRETALRFEQYLNHSARTPKGEPLAPRTKKNLVTGLSSLWRYMEHRQLVPRDSNPWTNLHISGERKPYEKDESAKRPWTDEEMIKLANGPELEQGRTVCTKRTIMEVFALAFYTGARLDEVTGRVAKDVEKTRGGFLLKIPTGKNKASVRDLPIINPIPAAILARRLKATKDTPDAPLFPEFRPGGYDEKRGKSASKKLARYRSKLGLVGALDTHGTRRTLLSLLEKKGAHPVWAQRYAGHTPQDMTHGVYAQGAASSLKEVAKLIQYPARVERAFKQALGIDG